VPQPRIPDSIRQSATHWAQGRPAPEGNCDEDQNLVYWLHGDEPIVLELELGQGADSRELPPRTVWISVFVDGLQVPFIVDGVEVPDRFEFLQEVGTGDSFQISVPASSIPDGFHLVSWVYTWSGDRGTSTLGSNSYVVKNSVCFADLDQARYPAVTSLEGYTDLVFDANGYPLYPVSPQAWPEPDGTLAVTAMISRWGSTTYPLGNPNVLLIATLDGRQIPLGDLGMRHYLRAPENLSEHVEVPIVLRDLPVGDGLRHRVHILKVTGYGEKLDTVFVNPVEPAEGWPTQLEIAGFNIGP
jgi:hypothetical protein